jgi:hypothetical protein
MLWAGVSGNIRREEILASLLDPLGFLSILG